MKVRLRRFLNFEEAHPSSLFIAEYVLRSRQPSPTNDSGVTGQPRHHRSYSPLPVRRRIRGLSLNDAHYQSCSRSRSPSPIYVGHAPRGDDERSYIRQPSQGEYEMDARRLTMRHPTYLPRLRSSSSYRSDIPSSLSGKESLDTSRVRYILGLLFETVPQQVYLHFLLRLPSLYFSRVARIFEDAELSLSDIEKMAATRMEEWNSNPKMARRIPSYALWNPNLDHVSPALQQFKSSWEDFVDLLINEWKVLNVISALLAS